MKVPPSAVAPSKHKSMEVAAINQVADGRAKGDESRFTATALLFDGRRSVEDRSKRTETVRPQLNERCEKKKTTRMRQCVGCDER